MTIRSLLFASVSAAALMFAAGCRTQSEWEQAVSRDEDRFLEIAGQIEAGGSYYSIQNPERLFGAAERIGSELDASLARADLPEEVRQRGIRYKTLADLLIHLAGIGEIRGFGASSTLLETGHGEVPPLFRNRAFLALPENPKGFLWAAVGTENRPLAREFTTLPANTIFAADFEFRPAELFRALQESEVLREAFEERIPAGVPQELLDGLSGEWAVLVTAAPDAPRLSLFLPDREGRLFELLRNGSQALRGAEISEKEISFAADSGFGVDGISPILTWDEGQLAIYSSAAARDEFLGEGPKLVESPEFRRMLTRLPSAGLGFFYCGAEAVRPAVGAVCEMLMPGVPPPIPEGGLPAELAILRREKNGLLTISNSTWDLNQETLAADLTLPLLQAAFADFFHQCGDGSDEDAEEDEAVDPVREEADQQECLRRLEKLRAALDRYAEKHDGCFPAGEDIAGLRELLQSGDAAFPDLICPGAEEDGDGDKPAETLDAFSYENVSYLYFGGGRKGEGNGQLPLLADWPCNHAARVNVLLRNGTIETLETGRIGSVKRIVGFLQAKYKYGEAEFRELIRIADKLDQMFELDETEVESEDEEDQ